MALSVQTLVYLPSLSSRLLLRNIPNFSHYSGLSAMSLSSLNRSNSKAFRRILPCVAPVCEGMHYHKTGVPWQINKILFMPFSFPEMPYSAPSPKRRIIVRFLYIFVIFRHFEALCGT